MTPKQIRDANNSPWKEEEKGEHLKNYEKSIKWPNGRPKTIKEYVDNVLEEELNKNIRIR